MAVCSEQRVQYAVSNVWQYAVSNVWQYAVSNVWQYAVSNVIAVCSEQRVARYGSELPTPRPMEGFELLSPSPKASTLKPCSRFLQPREFYRLVQ